MFYSNVAKSELLNCCKNCYTQNWTYAERLVKCKKCEDAVRLLGSRFTPDEVAEAFKFIASKEV